jgi:hypothetical protein
MMIFDIIDVYSNVCEVYSPRGKSKMQHISLQGEIKILVVHDKRNAAQEIQIDVTHYVERTDLVLLGEESRSGADRLTPRGLPAVIAGGICSWGMPIATCSSVSIISNLRNF